MSSLLQENLITTKEASELSGYHSDYLARMCRAGKIDGQQIGRSWLVSRTSVEQFMREQEERKRELAQELSRSREVEYKRIESEKVNAPAEDVSVPAVAAVATVEKPAAAPKLQQVALRPARPIVSPYAPKANALQGQLTAFALTLVILGGSVSLASSGVIERVAVGTYEAAVGARVAAERVIPTDALAGAAARRSLALFVPSSSISLPEAEAMAGRSLAPLAPNALLSSAGDQLFAFGIRARDEIANMPQTALDTELAIGESALSLMGVAHGIGSSVSSMLATGIVETPRAYDRTTTRIAERTVGAGESVLALGVKTDEALDSFAGAAPAAVASGAGTASAFAAFSPTFLADVRDWFLGKGEYLARTTYGSFSVFYDWAGYAVATIADPYSTRFPIVMVDYPQGGGNTTNIATTVGTTTVVNNIYQQNVTEGASIAYVDRWARLLERSIFESIENIDTDGGSGNVSFTGDIHVNSIIVDTTGSFAGALSAGDTTVNGDLTVTGDTNIGGTLTVANFTVTNLSVTGALIGPYFTATSTTATSSFAGGLYGQRIEAGTYIAGPYVLATSTTATSVFSGNIAANGNATIGDAGTDTLTVNASIASSLIPSTGGTYDLGSASGTWRNAYIDTVVATSASTTYATSTNLVATNFTLGSSLFSSLLGNGLVNAGGVLSVSTSSLASGFFQNGGNSFGSAASLGTNDAQSLSLETNDVPRIVIDASGNVGVGTSSPGSLLSLVNIANFTTGTSTFYASGGINLAGGCFAVNGVCLGGGSGSGTVSAGTAGQIAYYGANGSTVSGTSTVFVSPAGNVGVGTTSPYAKLSVVGQAVAEFFTATSTTATSTFPLAAITNALQFGADYLTDLTGSGLTITSGALTLDRTGAWTGTFDGQEGSYYLDRANHTGFQLASTISDFASTARGLFSSTATGLTYTSGTGVFSLTSGYTIPLTASTSEWASAYLARITSATYPLQIAGNVISLAFGTTTSNTWAGTQTFLNTLATNATTTSFGLNSETFTDLTGTGLSNVGGALTLNATGDWTGTFDGQEGTYYLANSFSTTSASYFLAQNQGASFSTTSANYWETQQIARTADDLSDNTTTDLAEGSNLYWTNTRFDNRLSATTTLPNLTTLANLTTVGTIGTGVWQGTAIGDAYLTKSGNWTGTFDGQEGTYYLDRANHTGTQLASTISDFAATARGLFSSTATGLTYTSGTGVFSLTSGYVIPLTASTTEWATAFGWGDHAAAGYESALTFSYPLVRTIDAISLAFGTTTNNTWAGTQTFLNTLATNATTTSFGINSETFTDLTGAGLSNVGGALTLNATGDWTGTFDGQEGTYYLDRANHTGTQLASTISDFSAAVGAYISGSSTVPHIGGSAFGDLLSWTGSAWGTRATSTLGIALGDTTGTLAANRGGTGHDTFVVGDIFYADTTNTLARLPIGSTGNVLKVQAGLPAWGVDQTVGSGGGDGVWATTTGYIYPQDTANAVIVGSGSTSTANSIFEVVGRSYFSNNVGIGTTAPMSLLSVGGSSAFSGLSTFFSGFNINSETFTDLTGAGLSNVGGALTLNATGDWTGTFDGQEGSYYLANSFSTTSASYFLSQNQGSSFSTTSANYFVHSSTTIPKTYTANTFTGAQVFSGGLTIGTLNGPLQANNGVVSATSSVGVLYGGTGLTTAPSYGQLLVGNSSGGYTLTATSSLGLAPAFTATYPLQYAANVLSLAFGTTTANSWSQLQTFASGFLATGSSTINGNATTTGMLGVGSLFLNAERFTDLTGTGLTISSGTLTLDATGNWTGTFDGQEGTYYLDRANHTGTQLASTISDFSAAADARINATSTIGTLTSAPSLGTVSTALTGILQATAGVLSVATAGTDYENPLTFSYPLVRTIDAISLAFGTTTNNTWAGTQTFLNTLATNATTTSFGINSETFTDLTGAGLSNVGGALTLNATGDWTGTFDGQEGTYYLDRANHTGTQLASTISDFSAAVGDYVTSSTTLAAYLNYWTKTGTELSYALGNVGIGTADPVSVFHVDAGSDRAIVEVDSNSVLSPLNLWNSNTGSAAGAGMLFTAGASPTAGFIGGVASQRIDAATHSRTALRVLSNNVLSGTDSSAVFYIEGASTPRIVANGNFGIGTSSPYAPLSVVGQAVAQYFTATSTTATSTFPNLSLSRLLFGSDYLTDITGTGLSIVSGALTVTTSGDWTGTFDGQEGSYYLANSFSTTSAQNFVHSSTTIPKTYSTNTFTGANVFSGSLTIGTLNGPLQANNGVVSATSSIGVLYGGTGLTTAPTYGQVLVGNGSGGYTLTATSTLGIENYWSVSGSDIYNSTGTNVGIGTTTPAAKLGVAGDIYASGFVNTSGGYQLFGGLLGYASTTNRSTVFGLRAGGTAATSSTAYYENTAIGYQALTSNSSGERNTAVGYAALFDNTSGDYNTAIGVATLANNTIGLYNTVVGYSHLNALVSGSTNVGLGTSGAAQLTSGSGNVIIGHENMFWATSATNTIAIGTQTGFGASQYAAQGSIYIGYRSGGSVGNGSDYNTFLGYQSGYNNTTGHNNLMLGVQPNTTGAGYVTTGDNNIGIGFNTRFPSATANNQINIGNFVFGTMPATSTASTFALPTTGALGIATSSPFATLSVHGNNGSTNTTLFAIGSSTGSATTTLFSVSNAGNSTLAGTSTAAGGAFTGFTLGSDYLSDITGSGLSITGGALNVVVTGDWTGTFDGQEGSYYLANSFSTTSAQNFVHSSTTIPKTYTANTFTGSQVFSGGLTVGTLNGPLQANNGVVSATSSIGVLYGGTGLTTAPTYGQMLVGNGSGGYTLTATSSLGYAFFENGGNSFDSTAILGTNDGHALAFETNGTNRMYINVDGDVGIGNETPSLSVGYSTLSLGNSSSGGMLTFQQAGTDRAFIYNSAGSDVLNLQAAAGVDVNDGSTSFLRVDTATGRVGVGSTTPWAQLSVNPDGVTGPAFAIGSSTATRFIVTNAGLVGIGTSSPVSTLALSAANPQLTFSDTDNGLMATINADGGGLAYNTATVNRDHLFQAGGSTLMTILGSGNVGIGTTTPFAELQVAGDSSLSSFRSQLVLTDTNGGLHQKHFGITYSEGLLSLGSMTDAYATSSPSTVTINTSGSLYAPEGLVTSGNVNAINVLAAGSVVGYAFTIMDDAYNFWSFATTTGRLALGTGNLLGSAIEPLSITDAGNLGVSSSSPYAKLSVHALNGDTNGTLFAIGSSTAAATTTLFSISNTGILTSNASATSTFSSGLNVAALNITGSATSTAANGINLAAGCFAINGTCIGTGSGTVGSGTTGQFPYYAANGTTLTATSSLFLATSGRVGIGGTTTPAAALGVAGDVYASGFFNTSAVTGGYKIDGQLLGYASSTNATTIFGMQAGGQNATTSGATLLSAFGYQALSGNTTGASNSAFGYRALRVNTTGSNNAAFGDSALSDNIAGNNNVAMGYQASTYNTAPIATVAIGSQSGGSATFSARGYTVVGYRAGRNSTTGADYNTFLGYQSGESVTTGYGNTLVGASFTSNNLTTGSGNIGIGYNTFFPSATGNNQLNIGGLVFGTLPATTTAFTLPTAGRLGIATSSPYAKLSVHANNGSTDMTLFAIGSSTASATTTLFSVLNSGYTGIGTTTPNARLTVWGDNTTETIFRVATTGSRNILSVVNNQVIIGSNAAHFTANSDVNTHQPQLTMNGDIAFNTGAEVGRSIFVGHQGGDTQGTHLTIRAGQGGFSDFDTGGDGGNLYLSGGLAGSGSTGKSTGHVLIASTTGKVGVGTTSPWGLLSVNPSATNTLTGPQFVVGSSTGTNLIVTNAGLVGIGTTSPVSLFGGKLAVAGPLYVGGASTTATSTFEGNARVMGNLAVGAGTTWIKDGATSTFNGGINLTGGGCFSVNGTCIGASGGSGTVGSGTTGQFPYYAANGTTLTATSSLSIATNGQVTIGSEWLNIGTFGSIRATDNYLGEETLSLFGNDSVHAMLGAGGSFRVFNSNADAIFQISEADFEATFGGTFTVSTTTTDPEESPTGITGTLLVNPSGASVGGTNGGTGVLGSVATGSGNIEDIFLISGVSGAAGVLGSGTVTHAYGINAGVQMAGSGTVTNAYGFSSQIETYTGAVTNAYGINVNSPIDAAAGATMVNNYGVYIQDQSGSIASGDEFNLYSAGAGLNYFGGSVGIGTTSPYAKLSVAGQIVGAYFTGTTTATSTLGGGLNITSGCFAINGTCVGGSGGSGTVGSGTTGQFPYYAANGTTLTATSSLFLSTAGYVGIGNASPTSPLSVTGNADFSGNLTISGTGRTTIATNLRVGPGSNGALTAATEGIETNNSSGGRIYLYRDDAATVSGDNLGIVYFGSTDGNVASAASIAAVAAESFSGTVNGSELRFNTTLIGASTLSERMRITDAGLVGIGTTTPGSILSVGGVANFTTATSTFYGTGGINIAGGCFAVNGTCISGSGGGGSGTVGSGTTGQFPYYAADGTTLTATSSLSISTSGALSVKAGSDVAQLNVGNFAIFESRINGDLEQSASLTSTQSVDIQLGATGFFNVYDSTEVAVMYVSETDGDAYFRGIVDADGGFTSDAGLIALTTGNILMGSGNILTSSGKIGVGTSTPWARLSVETDGLGAGPAFAVGSSTGTNLIVTNAGLIGIGTTTPGSILSVSGVANFTTATSTFYSSGGINLTGGGCFAINGTCISGGGGGGSGTVGSGTTGQFPYYAADGTTLTATSNLFMTAGGNIGIGTTTAAYPLQIASASGPQLGLSDGSATSPQWTFRNSGGTLYVGTTSPSTYATSSPSALELSSTGTAVVGIGTSTPWAQFSLEPTAANGTAPSFAIGSSTGTQFVVTNSGNVGIGTAIPTQKLSVNGNVALPSGGIVSFGTSGAVRGSDTFSALQTNGADRVKANHIGSIDFLNESSAVQMTILSGGNVGVGTTTPWGLLSVNANGINGAPQFVVGSSTATNFLIANNGRVGIATTTTSANYNFGVTGAGYFSTTLRTGGALTIGGAITSTGITVTGSGSVTSSFTAPTVQGTTAATGGMTLQGTSSLSPTTATLTLRAGNNSAVPTMTLARQGIGIGTTTPRYSLQIASSTAPQLALSNGSITVNAWTFRNAGGALYVATSSPSTYATSTVSALAINTSGYVGIGVNEATAQLHTMGTVRFEAFGAGSLQTDASGNVTVSSDERLKDIESSFGRGLAAIEALEPIIYRWNQASGLDRTTLYAGFSAQDVQGAIPEAVDTDPRGFLSLSDRPILAAAVNAIKELSVRTIDLSIATSSLSTRLASIEQELAPSEVPGDVVAATVSTTALEVAGDITAGSVTSQTFIATAAPVSFDIGSTTIAANLPEETLAEGGVNLYRLGAFALTAAQETIRRTDLIAERLASIEDRLAQLETATTSASFIPESAFESLLASAFSGFDATIENGLAYFKRIKVGELVIAKGEDKTSAVGAGTILAGNLVVEVRNPMAATTSKIIITPTSGIEGSWYVSDKGEGSFRVRLSENQDDDFTFDYLIIQTEGDDETEQEEQEAPEVEEEPTEEPQPETPPAEEPPPAAPPATEPPATEPPPAAPPAAPPVEEPPADDEPADAPADSPAPPSDDSSPTPSSGDGAGEGSGE